MKLTFTMGNKSAEFLIERFSLRIRPPSTDATIGRLFWQTTRSVEQCIERLYIEGNIEHPSALAWDGQRFVCPEEPKNDIERAVRGIVRRAG